MKYRKLPRSEDHKRIGLSLPESLYNALKMEADNIEVSISFLAQKAFRHYLQGRKMELTRMATDPNYKRHITFK